MPFVSIRISGSATREQKAGIVGDVTRSLAERLGKSPAAVQVVIEEVSPENYGAGGVLIADRDAPAAPASEPAAGPAPGAEPELALAPASPDGEDADAEPTR